MSATADAGADRPTVVLLHSSGSTPKQWRALADMLREDFRVLAVEFHGHGATPEWAHERPMTLADEAAAAAELLELAGGAHVVGHSYGGAVALKLACMLPHLVRSAVVYEPVLFRMVADDAAQPYHWRDVVAAAESMRDDVEQGDALHSAQTFVNFWSGAGAWQAMPPQAQASVAERMPSVIRHFHALFADGFATDELGALTLPLLVLSGARTVPVTRRIAQLLRTTLPAAQHEVLPCMGHLGPITHAEAVNERIGNFLLREAQALH